jgi:hypothetical protein
MATEIAKGLGRGDAGLVAVQGGFVEGAHQGLARAGNNQ